MDFNENSGCDSRTIFVGNIPVHFNKKKFLKLAKQYGNVERMWIRGIKLPLKKIALNKNIMHDDHPPLISYVLFQTSADAQNALNLNGHIFENSHLRVTLLNNTEYDSNKGVFLGNLPLNIKDDDVYKMFIKCGDILGVRIVRDSVTGIGKGFGYVNFKSVDGVELALELNGQLLNGREIRVQRLLRKGQKKKKDKEKLLCKGQKKKKDKGKFQMKINLKNKNTTSKQEKRKIGNTYRGTESRSKLHSKKKKLSRTDFKKKIIAKKLAVTIKKKE